MSVLAEISIEAWSAWAPGLSSREAWLNWARIGSCRLPEESLERPPVQFMPPMLRRRCGDGARAALAVAYACLKPDDRMSLPVVFASRHGEAQTTLSILQSLAKAEPLSPMDFSLSVHNASSGIFSIATGNTAPASAIAARRGIVAAGFLEGLSQTRSRGGSRFLCVFQEEPVPSQFLSPSQYYPELFGLALLCRETDANSDRFALVEQVSSWAMESVPEEVEALSFLKWWLAGEAARFELTHSLGLLRVASRAKAAAPTHSEFVEPGTART